MNSRLEHTALSLPNSMRHPCERSFPPLVKGGRRGGGHGATRHTEIRGTGGGGQGATRHVEIKVAREWSRRFMSVDVQCHWSEACSFVSCIVASIVPDSSLTAPPGPPYFTRGGK
jgi:hypothetical protein